MNKNEEAIRRQIRQVTLLNEKQERKIAELRAHNIWLAEMVEPNVQLLEQIREWLGKGYAIKAQDKAERCFVIDTKSGMIDARVNLLSMDPISENPGKSLLSPPPPPKSIPGVDGIVPFNRINGKHHE